MSISQLSINELKQAIRLIEQKEALLAKIAEIDRKLEALGSGQGKSKPQKTNRAKTTGSKRRMVTAEILTELMKGGDKGTESIVLAKKLRLSSSRLSAWFATTGKKYKEIKRIGRGKHTWTAAKA